MFIATINKLYIKTIIQIIRNQYTFVMISSVLIVGSKMINS